MPRSRASVSTRRKRRSNFAVAHRIHNETAWRRSKRTTTGGIVGAAILNLGIFQKASWAFQCYAMPPYYFVDLGQI